MQPQRVRREDLVLCLKGFLMGGADIIPGVSGGTVALILGIYGRFVTSLSRVDTHLVSLIRQRQWRTVAAYLDLRFMIALVLGIATGILSLAGVMHYLLEHHFQLTTAVFFGLILASSILVIRMIPQLGFLEVLLIVVGGCAAFGLVGMLPQTPPQGQWYNFFAGAIAICAMLLPGVSGSFLLLILGKYYEITGYISGLKHGELTLDAFLTLTVFSLGCLFGLGTFSKLLKWMLRTAEGITLATMCGLMLGSLRKIWPFQVDLTPDVADFKLKRFENVWPEQWGSLEMQTVMAMLLAAAFVFALDYLVQGSHHGSDSDPAEQLDIADPNSTDAPEPNSAERETTAQSDRL